MSIALNRAAARSPGGQTKPRSFRAGDRVFALIARVSGASVLVLLGGIIVVLFFGGIPAFRAFGAAFIVSPVWNPVTEKFGAAVAIYGTIVTSILALVFAVPVSFGIAFYLTELAPPWLRRPVGTAIELLAAIPSIIYGMWGFFVIVPIMARFVQPWMISTVGALPLVGRLFQGPPFGTGIFTAALILAIMVIPFIAATMRDVFETVPTGFKESAYSVGCTTWEVVRYIVIPYTRVSVVGGIMLGLGRALGETMAVTFVVGNTNRLGVSLFRPGNTIASLVALEFPESQAGSLKLASLLALGFILFVISFLVLAASHMLLRQRPMLLPAPPHTHPSVTDSDSGTGERAGPGPTKDRLAAQRLGRHRHRLNTIVDVLCVAATVVGLGFLASILFSLLWRGAGGLDAAVFTRMTLPPGSHGGLLNAIMGSLIQTGIGALIGTPVGLMVGTYLSEYDSDGWLANTVRFVSDVLLSAPSILIGLFIYQLIVAPFGGFSGLAGALALAVIVIPIVVRTTENMLRLVPASLREAAVALGAPKWKVIVQICYRATRAGLVTGVLLAVARIAGETAPLLFTSLGNLNWSLSLTDPMASLPVTIYQYAGSAFEDWVELAWVGALLITMGVLVINIVARFVLRGGSQ